MSLQKLIGLFMLDAHNDAGQRIRLARKIVARANKHPMSLCLLSPIEQSALETAKEYAK